MDSTGLRLVIRWDTAAREDGFEFAIVPGPESSSASSGSPAWTTSCTSPSRRPTAHAGSSVRGHVAGGSRYGQTDDGKLYGVEAFSVEADVPGGPHAAARARRLIESELDRRLPRSSLDDVALLTTELVANGVRHGGGGRDAVAAPAAQGGGPGLRVEVENADRVPSDVAQRQADMSGGGGIGLHLVERLASRWGVRERAARPRSGSSRLLVPSPRGRQASRRGDRRPAAVAVEPRQGPLPGGGVHEGPRHRLLHARGAGVLRHLRGRPLTLKRYPNGVDAAALLREAVPVARAGLGADDAASTAAARATARSTSAWPTTCRRSSGWPTSPTSSCTPRWRSRTTTRGRP